MSQEQQDHAYMECVRAIAGLENERNALTRDRLRISAGLNEIAADLAKDNPEWLVDRETAEAEWLFLWRLREKHKAIDALLAERQAERDRYRVF